ncbi:hypothetical protein [Collimonas humicola]|uniref:hypothetical protein n=1 Tax=Collimonas humicola TaxID=2825886 RepID=UPI001B8C078C|nr:hypothetical protein [Collimonas humicola]
MHGGVELRVLPCKASWRGNSPMKCWQIMIRAMAVRAFVLHRFSQLVTKREQGLEVLSGQGWDFVKILLSGK